MITKTQILCCGGLVVEASTFSGMFLASCLKEFDLKKTLCEQLPYLRAGVTEILVRKGRYQVKPTNVKQYTALELYLFLFFSCVLSLVFSDEANSLWRRSCTEEEGNRQREKKAQRLYGVETQATIKQILTLGKEQKAMICKRNVNTR